MNKTNKKVISIYDFAKKHALYCELSYNYITSIANTQIYQQVYHSSMNFAFKKNVLNFPVTKKCFYDDLLKRVYNK